jgi:hypothetical protein
MFNEAGYENAVISLLEDLGYEHKYGPDIKRDYHNPLYMDALKVFTNWLQNGLEVSYQGKGETKTDILNLVDFKNPANNVFQVVNQWTYIENSNHRPDMIIFVNGFPLVVVELKTCMNEDVGIENGYYNAEPGKGGVFWHTQGSGKSLSMVFYAALLGKAMESPLRLLCSPTVTILTISSMNNSVIVKIFCAKRRNRRKAERIYTRSSTTARQTAFSFRRSRSLKNHRSPCKPEETSSSWPTKPTGAITA